MEYTNLGRTGLSVSRLCLGTMNFGPKTSEPDSFAIMDRASVQPPSIRQSAAAWKSSNTFCLCSRMPARCQSSPSSAPPRRLATAYTPPAATQARACGVYSGTREIAKPPYPVSSAGRGRSGSSVGLSRNRRTCVPSADL
jgi:hypothetical protein